MEPQNPPSHKTLLVWDMATRLFHWTLVGLIIALWRTAEMRDLSLHKMLGFGVAGLMVFRLWWGLFGTTTARFAEFIKGPRQIMTYLGSLVSTSKSAHAIGHNPVGGLSVIALILGVITLVVSGLFASDTDGLDPGPLSSMIDNKLSDLVSKIHDYAFTALEGLVVLHLLAIIFYALIKRQNLIGAMITGKTKAPEGMKPAKKPSVMVLIMGLILGLATSLGLMHLDGRF